MTTLAHPLTRDFATRWDNAIASAVFAGIVAGGSHVQNGYHVCIADNPFGNYSIIRVDDKAPPGTWPRDLAAAVDMSMSPADMILTYKRVYAVWSNPNDIRRKYFNAWNVFDGVGDAERLDFVTGSRSYASPDHKTHTHGEFRRRYVTVPAAYDAAFSMVSGEGLTAYLTRNNLLPSAPKPPAVGTVPGTRTLRLTTPNMVGDDVRAVETFIGPYRCGTVDRTFTAKTREGVIWYQKMRGILADGIVGPQTWSHILGRRVQY